MRILLVAATEFEIAGISKNFSFIDYLITGVGNPASIYSIIKKLQTEKYAFVIQAGIAGTFTRSLNLGEVVFVAKDCFADVAISEKGSLFTIFEKGFAVKDRFPFEDGWLSNKDSVPSGLNCKSVTGITINTVTDDIKQIHRLQKKYNPDIETMEGAALHYVCLLEEVPFLQVRAISNLVGERNKEKWKIKEAVQNLNIVVGKIIAELAKMKSAIVKT